MQKHKINLLGRETEVTDLEIVERKGEHIAEYRLEDGAVIRVATPATLVRRLEGQTVEGSPIYLVWIGTSTTVVSPPPDIKTPGSE